jgi:hypothetical protein
VVSLVRPLLQIWPPPGRDSWQYRLVWTLTGLCAVGLAAVGVLDWNTLSFSHWFRIPIGTTLIVGGLALALWAVRVLGVHATSGLQDSLVEVGPYRFTRNPQYVARDRMVRARTIHRGTLASQTVRGGVRCLPPTRAPVLGAAAWCLTLRCCRRRSKAHYPETKTCKACHGLFRKFCSESGTCCQALQTCSPVPGLCCEANEASSDFCSISSASTSHTEIDAGSRRFSDADCPLRA